MGGIAGAPRVYDTPLLIGVIESGLVQSPLLPIVLRPWTVAARLPPVRSSDAIPLRSNGLVRWTVDS